MFSFLLAYKNYTLQHKDLDSVVLGWIINTTDGTSGYQYEACVISLYRLEFVWSGTKPNIRNIANSGNKRQISLRTRRQQWDLRDILDISVQHSSQRWCLQTTLPGYPLLPLVSCRRQMAVMSCPLGKFPGIYSHQAVSSRWRGNFEKERKVDGFSRRNQSFCPWAVYIMWTSLKPHLNLTILPILNLRQVNELNQCSASLPTRKKLGGGEARSQFDHC